MSDGTRTLHSHASSGGVELELDRVELDGRASFELTITLPAVQLRLTIGDSSLVDGLSRFASQHYGRTAHEQIHLGHLENMPVLLVKDDEYPDRFFLRAAGMGMLEITLTDPLTTDFMTAAVNMALT